MSFLRIFRTASGAAARGGPSFVRAIRSSLPAVMLAALLAGTACESPTLPPRFIAYSYAFTGFGLPVVYRWPVGEEIGVHIVPAADADSHAALVAAFEHAARAWNATVLYGQFRLERAPLERADVVLAWVEDPLPVVTDDCPPLSFGAAWATFCANEANDAIGTFPLAEGEHASDGVHMLVQVLGSERAIPGRVAALLVHEFGHVLGIGTHPCRWQQTGCATREGASASVMFSGIPDRLTPSSADQATIELLYHTPADLTP